MFPRVTHPSAANIRRCPLDLHVLGLPPAFVLSQDQTLKLKCRCQHILDVRNLCTSLTLSGKPSYRFMCAFQSLAGTENQHQTVKLTPVSSKPPTRAGKSLTGTICEKSDPSNQTKPPTYLFKISTVSKSERQKPDGPLFLTALPPAKPQSFICFPGPSPPFPASPVPLPHPGAAPVRFGEGYLRRQAKDRNP